MKLVKAELQKLFTTRLWWIMLVVMLLLTAVNLGFLIGFAGTEQAGTPGLPPRDDPAWLQLAWATGSGGGIFVMILGVVMMTSEYRYQTITGTFLTTPRRTQVIIGKLVSGLIVGVLFGLGMLVFLAVVTVPTVLLSGGSFAMSEAHIPQSSIGIVASLALYAVFGIGLGALVRNQIAGIVAAVVWTFVIESIFTAFTVLQPIGKWLPGGASSALMNIDIDIDTGLGRPELLPAWGGALVLIAYGLVFGLVASATTVRRDIT
jgi:ABC-type transport system involved in multi-copper enzyme maturation permease subunit